MLRHLSNRAFAVREALHRAGVGSFLPTYQVETRWSDRTKRVEKPLFEGYIFARFDAESADTILRTTRGVYEILSIDGKPEAVPDAVIANLQRLASRGGKVARCPYVAGVTITVERGPFAGVCGIVTRTQGEPGLVKLTIPVQILGRAVDVELDAADVREVAK